MAVKTKKYLGVGDVAGWFGVSAPTVTKWLARYADVHPTPVPDAQIGEVKGWLPSREQEWRWWEKDRPGRGAGGGPKPKTKAGAEVE